MQQASAIVAQGNNDYLILNIVFMAKKICASIVKLTPLAF